MQAIQLLMDETSLRLLDREARRLRTDRSKLVREAVRRYLAKLIHDADEREYVESLRRRPQETREVRAWERLEAWPAD